MYGKKKAAQLWHDHNLSTPVDLKRLVSELGIEVVTFPFNGRLKEVIIDGVIGVRPGLSRGWFRWVVAHGVGHQLLHVGTSFYLESWQWVNHARDERQAEEFAAWLLGGPTGWQYSAQELGIPGEKLMLVQILTGQASAGGSQQIELSIDNF